MPVVQAGHVLCRDPWSSMKGATEHWGLEREPSKSGECAHTAHNATEAFGVRSGGG